MMLRRFKLFAIGVLMGSVVLIYLFQKREGLSWLPKDKLKENLTKYPVSFSDKSSCQLACLGISTEELKASFAQAEIDFGKSKVDQKPCPVYQMEIGLAGKNKLTAFVEICDSTNALISIESLAGGPTCKCD